MTKWPVQKPTRRTTQKHVEHQAATDIQKKLLFVFFSLKVTMVLDGADTVLPGADVSLVISTNGDSFVATAGLDKRVELLAENENVITNAKVRFENQHYFLTHLKSVYTHSPFSKVSDKPFLSTKHFENS